MGMWGGGAGAGGWSQGIGGQAMGPRSGGVGSRGYDGWDDDYLGKVYDARVVKRLIPYLMQFKLQAGIALVSMVVSAVTSFIQPLMVGLAVQAGIEGNTNRVWWLLGWMVGLAGLGIVAQVSQQLATAHMGNRLLLKLRTEMYEHMQGLSLDFYDNQEVGRMISRLTSDVTVMQELLTSGTLTFLADFVGLAVVIAILVGIDWQLALVTFAIVPPLVAIMAWWSRHARQAFMNVRIKVSQLYGNLAENVSGVRAVQSMSRESENAKRFDALNQDNRNANIWAGMLSAAIMPVIELTVAIATAAVIIVGGLRALNAGSVDLAHLFLVLTTFTLAVSRFFDPIRDLVLQYTMVQRAMAGGERIFEVLDTPARIQDKPDALELQAVEGRVDFDHVSFHYIEGIPVLRDIDLHVAPGETIAFVGHTGAGKTTITSLVSRGYEVTSGAIRIDGHDIRDIKRRSLTRHMGVVLQNPYLFSGTVRENIAYGRPEATQESVEAAARAVGAHDFISRLEHGYDTVLQQRGQNLSVGQRQLISFARAILAQPRILVLDEATAYVDTQTEVIIQRALRELLKDRTSFVIAHRLSTIREANRIVVLDKGSIAEIGSHDELLAKDGIYANLYKMTYQQEQARHDAESIGEDVAFAMRRRGEMAGTVMASPIEGDWTIRFQTPGGQRESNVTLSIAHGALTGTYTGSMGVSTIFDATSDGTAFSFSIENQGPMGKMKLSFKGTVNGDMMAGDVQFGAMGKTAFEGSRATLAKKPELAAASAAGGQ
jgi:ATP-binding cassette subfamily B protein